MEINRLMNFLHEPFFFFCFSLGLDAILGDPPYAWHPIRIQGRILAWAETRLRALGLAGRFGGFLLFLIILVLFGGGFFSIRYLLGLFQPWLAWLWDAYLAYSLLALGDLVSHGRRIAKATTKGDLVAARNATAMLVGRDTEQMDLAACNRAAVESVAESLVDGIIAPLFWFALLGLPGLILFKIASTMDSMVGYKSERYLYFGWFGARLDDVMNFIPARLGWLLIVLASAMLPRYSARKAWIIGKQQHSLLPGPNKGWSETAATGALQIRLAGPIYKNGILVNDLWIGATEDREGGEPGDVTRMIMLTYATVLLFVILAWILYSQGWNLINFNLLNW
jgi:adenosylcobinamide-phosphate synthase